MQAPLHSKPCVCIDIFLNALIIGLSHQIRWANLNQCRQFTLGHHPFQWAFQELWYCLLIKQCTKCHRKSWGSLMPSAPLPSKVLTICFVYANSLLYDSGIDSKIRVIIYLESRLLPKTSISMKTNTVNHQTEDITFFTLDAWP